MIGRKRTESILDFGPLFNQDFDGNGSGSAFVAGLKFLGGSEVGDTSLRLVKEGV